VQLDSQLLRVSVRHRPRGLKLQVPRNSTLSIGLTSFRPPPPQGQQDRRARSELRHRPSVIIFAPVVGR
jgi:hypothetical protein